MINLTEKFNLDADFFLIEDFLEQPDMLLSDIINHVNFEQFFTHTNKPVPRLIQHFGAEYKYYNTHHPEKEIPSFLEYLKDDIEFTTNIQFNAILINLYPNQNSTVSWHSDNEQCLGKNPFIASFSLGETRKFCIRHTETFKEYGFEIKHNDLLIMGNNSQNKYLHCIPKHPTKCSPRINLTFRRII
ncbi:MAG: alpha-ketoglutarate-dependent dioxygenase AlkB [Candidatus Riesia sp.]|nr:alpha-ketoglutarate-dependent dioxygenase AlkB [Candidatus Riesia sp.]